eukprot:UN07328
MTFVSNPSSYWGVRLRKFVKNNPEEGLQQFKDAVTNDAVAWSVFAALLMTVGFAGVLLSSGDFIEEQENMAATYIYIATQYSVALFSLLGVIVATLKYSFFNNIPNSMLDKAIASSKHPNLVYFIYGAIFLQCIASIFAAYLLLGIESAIIVIVLFILFTLLFGLTLWKQKQSYEGIGMFVVKNN